MGPQQETYPMSDDSNESGTAASVATSLPTDCSGRPLKFMRSDAEKKIQLIRDCQKMDDAIVMPMLTTHFPTRTTLRTGPSKLRGDYVQAAGLLLLPMSSPLDDSTPWYENLNWYRQDGYLRCKSMEADRATRNVSIWYLQLC